MTWHAKAIVTPNRTGQNIPARATLNQLHEAEYHGEEISFLIAVYHLAGPLFSANDASIGCEGRSVTPI